MPSPLPTRGSARILFVAIPNSIHTARWLAQLRDREVDVHLFSAYEAPVHRGLRRATVYRLAFTRGAEVDPSVRLRGLWPTERGAARITHHFGRLFGDAFPREAWLAALIRRLRPDLVHSLEVQRSGYLTLAARDRLDGSFPPWIVSSWGSDIYLYGRLAEHEGRVRRVLESCNLLHTDCERDIGLAHELGFRGETFGVFPVGGGFDLDELRSLAGSAPPSRRRLVVLKGQQYWSGRALVGIRALELCADALAGYRVFVPIAYEDVRIAAELVARRTGIVFEFESEWIDRQRLLARYGEARVSIALGISDGAPVSMLESMAMGALPIQSCTSCAGEWITDGVNGLVVPPEDPEAVAAAIRRALTDDVLVDQAAKANERIAAERLDERVVGPRVLERYEHALGRSV